jgi:hypothetical protein
MTQIGIQTEVFRPHNTQHNTLIINLLQKISIFFSKNGTQFKIVLHLLCLHSIFLNSCLADQNTWTQIGQNIRQLWPE